jgi:hypothetical protein
MTKSISLVTAALMLAVGFAGAASAADTKKAPVAPAAHPRTQASLQCSADADAKNLHGKARSAFRHDCMHKAAPHKAAYKKPAHPTAPAHKADKADGKT